MKATVHHVRILRSAKVARAQFTVSVRRGRRVIARGLATLQGDAGLSEDSIQFVEPPHDLSAELRELQDAGHREDAGQAVVNAILDACFAKIGREA